MKKSDYKKKFGVWLNETLLAPEPIPCKTPKEIDIQYRTYLTTESNLMLKLRDLQGDKAYLCLKKIEKLRVKIELLENILKIKK